MANTALINAPSRKIFAPLFKARWQNCQNIVNDSVYIDLIPAGYKTYYQAFIRQWQQWAQGFVLQLHSSDFFSTGMGYTVCDIMTKKCMSGGFRIHSNDPVTKEMMEQWGEDNDLVNTLNKMFFFSNSGGNSILVNTPVGGDLYPSVYPINRAVFQIGRTKKISQILLLNRFIAGETVYYVREIRVMHKGKPYWKVELANGTLVTAPTWNGGELKAVPLEILSQWQYCYGDLKPGIWYKMPEKMRNLGCYNVRNKSVAVALQDLPGYSDSTLHTALDILYSIDYNYTQSQVDQYLGRGRTLIPKQFGITRLINQPGTLADGMSFKEAVNFNKAPLDDTFYTEIPDNNINGDKVQPTFIQPDLRGDVHKYIRDADLELLAAKAGLSSSDLANHLNGHTSGTKTDDEIVQEGNTTENSVNNKRALANTAINEMLADVAYFYGYSEDVDIQWGRAAANSARENQELMQDYQAGTLPLREYLRRRWTDLREEDVEKLALEIEEEQKKNQIMFDERDYFGENNDNSEQAAEYAGDSVGGSGNRNKENSQG
jgi:hypothetical protein